LEALEEAVAIMRAMWSGERRGLGFDGRYYQLSGVHAGPAPAHPIQIWIGANKPRALALTGRVADGWVSPLMSYKPPREAAQANLVIDRAAPEAGRDPRATRRIYNVQGAFTRTAQGPAADTDQGIVGPPAHWVEALTHLALALGFGRAPLATPPGCESAWPSDAPPRPYPRCRRSTTRERRARLRADPGDRPRAPAVPDAAHRPRGHPRRARPRRTPRGRAVDGFS